MSRNRTEFPVPGTVKTENVPRERFPFPGNVSGSTGDKTETEYKKIEYDEEESSSSQSADEEQSPESSDISQEISDVLNDL